MNMNQLLHLLPTMDVIEEAFILSGWHCSAFVQDKQQAYRNVRLFTGQQTLLPDVLYTLRPGETEFPTDSFAYICTTPIHGNANHICCPDATPEAVLDFLLELYSRFQQQEMLLDQLTYQGNSLQELCSLSEELLGNPVCIHDDWFIVIGMSQQAQQIMAPEYLMSSAKGFLPRVILDDFQHDSDYLETYDQTEPQIWDGSGNAPNSLYVNLWEEAVYRGRLVVIQQNRTFHKCDLLLSKIIAQRVIFLLQRRHPEETPALRGMDDVVFSLLNGRYTEAADRNHLLRMLKWEKTDPFLCIRLRPQQPEVNPVTSHILHSDLFRIFPGSYILLSDQEQCLILDLQKSSLSYNLIPHMLASVCRDYCLYAGISSPVSGIAEWNLAYYQAGIALDQAFRLRSEKWIIPFSHCALDHMLSTLSGRLQPSHMVSPELRLLVRHDEENGTQYFETLREYLLQERDIPRTSQKLIIHRTTLLYRLKKIQSLISVNLEDPWQRLYLITSLWIMEKEQIQR